MEQKIAIKEQIFPESSIPDSILKIRLNIEQKHTLSYGEEIFLNNMELKDGSVRDGKVKLVKDNSTGELSFAFNFKREELEIPKHLFDKELSEEDQRNLINGKIVGPLNYKGNDFFIQIDQELNRVTINHSSQFNLHNDLGGYRFTSDEQKLLLNGNKISTHVFKGDNGYFMANVQLSSDRRSIIFSNTKSLDKEEALKLIEKFNKKEELLKFSENKTVQETGQKNEELVSPAYRELDDPIHQRDYKKINDLVSSGCIPSADQLESIKLSNAFTHEEKLSLLTCLKIENPSNFLSAENSINSKPDLKIRHSDIDKQNTISF